MPNSAQCSKLTPNSKCKHRGQKYVRTSIRIIWSLLLTPKSPIDFEFLSAELWGLGSLGIEDKDGSLCAYFPDDVSHHSVIGSFPDHPLELSQQIEIPPLPDPLLADPVLAATRFVIAAAEAKDLPTGRIHLPVVAGMAFGTGRHETTQLCLRALELYLEPHHIMFDVGCGSGILSLAAQKLGASQVIASDFDSDSLTVARRHFAGPIFAGSADGFPTSGAHLVVSNITGPVNDRIAADLHRITKPEGWLVVSGFTTETAPKHFHPMRVLSDGDWLCWICRPDPQLAETFTPDDPQNHQQDWWL